ncbi:MAG TPA: flippase [Armatimonadota bacterium]|nr:flippase [Armatimonadota bacterium]HOM72866.1 flippase [Armatimonadota bacterium]
MTPKAPAKNKPGGDSLARGTIALISVQIAFMAGGYIIHFYLGRSLGPVQYGVFGVVITFLIWVEVSLTGGFPYAIRKFGAEKPESMSAIARAAMRGQLIYSILLCIIAVAASPWIAALLRDPSLTGFLRLASLDIPIFAFYFAYNAVLNGKRLYSRQAIAMSMYAVTKVAAIILLVMLGFGIKGALVGNIIASAGGLMVAFLQVGRLQEAEPYPIRRLISYSGATATLSVCFTLLISVDVFMVKAMSSISAEVGYYTAASTIARAPFYVFLGISMATLPVISRAASESDNSLVRQYVRQAFRLHMLLLAPITAIISGTAVGTVGLLYTNQYSEAGPVLGILITALMMFGFLHTLYNVMVAYGDTHTPVLGTTVLIILNVLGSVVLVPKMGITGAAVAAIITSIIGFFVSSMICKRRLGVFIPLGSVIRIAFAAVVIYTVARFIPLTGIELVGLYIMLFLLYGVVLVVTGEIKRIDIDKVGAAIGLSRKISKPA